jgi:hypothetical protein
VHRQLREREAGDEAECAAGDADKRAFRHNRQHQTAARDAKHAQQRKLLAAANDCVRLRGEHEQGAGEKRDQREHVQVHAIRSRQARARRYGGLGPNELHAGWQHRAQPFLEGVLRNSRTQSHVDAREQPQPIERRLRGCDIHETEALVARGGELACHPQRHVAKRDLHAKRVTDGKIQGAQSGRAQEERIGSQGIEAVDGARDHSWLQVTRAKHVDADDPQRCVPPGELGIDFYHGARDGHVPQPRDLWIEGFRKAAARPADFEIGVAGQRLHALRKLVDGRGVDELHRVTERDPERYRDHRQRGPCPVLRERRARDHRNRTGMHRHFGASPSRLRTSTRSAVAAAATECVTRMPAAPFVLT